MPVFALVAGPACPASRVGCTGMLPSSTRAGSPEPGVASEGGAALPPSTVTEPHAEAASAKERISRERMIGNAGGAADF